jgi:hypothetical protein
MNKQVREKIKEINRIITEQCPSYTLDLEPLKTLDAIRSDTKLRFIETTHTFGDPKVITRMYKHFKYRGLPSISTSNQLTLYLVIFRNKKTGELHYKFGTTKSVYIPERFQKNSNTWEYVQEAVCSRRGPHTQIRAIEKRIKEFATKNGIIQHSVEDFIYGGQTEVLIATHKIPFDVLFELLRIFADNGFDGM